MAPFQNALTTDVATEDALQMLPETDVPQPPPPAQYSTQESDQRLYAGYRDMALYMNQNARKAFQNLAGNDLYINKSALPFQDPSKPGTASAWMTQLWDYSQEKSGAYVGLRGKWLSNIVIPETHDAMAVAHSPGWGCAQLLPFRDQLFGGIRSFDMRYVLGEKGYVGSHYFPFELGSMESCIAGLVQFFSGPVNRHHEFMILKLRYGTGQNNETPEHTDDDALTMLWHFINRLKLAGLLDRVLWSRRDASGNPLPDSCLPFATLEQLNVDSSGKTYKTYRNIMLTAQPDYLVDAWNERYSGAPYFWPNSAVETFGTQRFNGRTSQPRFGISIVGVDKSGLSPDRDGSKQLASIAVDAMLYTPNSAFLYSKDLNDKGSLVTRNDYGGLWNFNFVSANFFEDTPFVNNLIEINKYNAGTDIWDLDAGSTEVRVATPQNGPGPSASIASGRYYGSLQVAQAVEKALNTLTPQTGIDFGVRFDGNFTVVAKTTALSGAVAAVVNQQGEIEVFAIGTDGALWHIWQTPGGTGPWSPWYSLGGTLKGTPSVVRNIDGRLQVFARGMDDTQQYNCQAIPGSNAWDGWQSLGGILRSDPAAAVNADGRLEVFVRGTDNQVWHIFQNAPNDNHSWTPAWHALGGSIMSTPVVVMNVDGRLEVFGTWIDGSVAHIWQQHPHAGPWYPQGWAKLPRAFCVAGTPAVAVHSRRELPWYGAVQVFARGTDNQVRYIMVRGNYVLTPLWTKFDGVVNSDPILGVNTGERLELFARGMTGDLLHIWQWNPGFSSWYQEWQWLASGISSRPAVARNADGRLEVFAAGNYGSLEHIWQTPGGPGPWSGMESLGFPVTPKTFQLVETHLSKRLGFGTGTSPLDWKVTAETTIFPGVHYVARPETEQERPADAVVAGA